MESQINDNSFIDNENIHNYIKKNKYNLDEINQEIDILDKVYEQIVILNHQISDSNRSIDRLKETNCGKLDIFNGYWKTIFTTYDNLFLNSENNIDIKVLKLKIFNLEKKKELQEILNIHISEDIIKQKLSALYEKKISIL